MTCRRPPPLSMISYQSCHKLHTHIQEAKNCCKEAEGGRAAILARACQVAVQSISRHTHCSAPTSQLRALPPGGHHNGIYACLADEDARLLMVSIQEAASLLTRCLNFGFVSPHPSLSLPLPLPLSLSLPLSCCPSPSFCVSCLLAFLWLRIYCLSSTTPCEHQLCDAGQFL